MSMPAFTADATLYRTKGHYQTRRSATNLAPQAGHTVHLSLGISDEGPIEVHSCRAGYLQIGEGENMRCVDPTDPFGTRGHDGGGLPSGGADDGETTGGFDTETPYDQTCTPKELQSKEARPCIDKLNKDVKAGKRPHFLQCRTENGKRIMECCQHNVRSGMIRRDCEEVKSK